MSRYFFPSWIWIFKDPPSLRPAPAPKAHRSFYITYPGNF